MRPGRFHPGNFLGRGDYDRQEIRFNEAGAFPPRKFPLRRLRPLRRALASMRPGRFHPGNSPKD